MTSTNIEAEKARLHSANYTRGRQATELITWITQHGYLKAARLASLTRLRQAEHFTYRLHAYECHRRIAALLALRAVEYVEASQHGYQPHRPTQRQARFLRTFYEDRINQEQKDWCRQQLLELSTQKNLL